jgi:DNA repair protein RadC
MSAQKKFAYSTSEEVIDAAKSIMESMMKQRDVTLTSPGLVRQYLSTLIGRKEHEVFYMLYLDSQNRLIASEELFRGTIDGASVYPREVVKAVLKHNAAACLMAHNHPSGVSDPSESDKNITKRLKSALELIDVRVLDHIIVGDAESFSFAEQGLL